jgi:uronate dehydrogenase
MKRLTVLLTGASGRIARHLIPSFRGRYDLRLLDKKPIPDAPDAIITDLQDAEALRNAMQGVDVVVHLAAQPDEAPFLEVLLPNNVIGMYNTFQAAHEAGVRRIVFASTVQTIDFNPPGTVRIDDPPHCISLYAATKVFGETVGRWYHDKHGLEFIGVRVGAFQEYDRPNLRKSRWLRNIWFSPRDCIGVFQAAVEKEGIGYALVFGTSITEEERMDRTPMREVLGYEPQDDVRVLYPIEANPGG